MRASQDRAAFVWKSSSKFPLLVYFQLLAGIGSLARGLRFGTGLGVRIG